MAFTAAFAQSGSETLEPIDEIGGKNVGRLNCTVEGGWGLLIGSSKATTCAFDRTGG